MCLHLLDTSKLTSEAPKCVSVMLMKKFNTYPWINLTKSKLKFEFSSLSLCLPSVGCDLELVFSLLLCEFCGLLFQSTESQILNAWTSFLCRPSWRVPD